MAKCFYDADDDPALLAGRTSRSVRLRQPGPRPGAEPARLRRPRRRREPRRRLPPGRRRRDGLPLRTIGEAAAGPTRDADRPDEVQPAVYERRSRPNLRAGGAVCFRTAQHPLRAIEPRPDLDVILVAPKMIGEFVRTHYVDGSGFPSLVAVGQDATGQALGVALALARAIGGTTRGAFLSTFEEETVTDLFGEQVGGAGMLGSTLLSFETLVAPATTPRSSHSSPTPRASLRTSCGGRPRRTPPQPVPALLGQPLRPAFAGRTHHPAEAKDTLRAVLAEIQSGAFAVELSEVAEAGYERVSELLERYGGHPLFKSEARVRAANAGLRSPDLAVASAPRAPWAVEA